MSIFQLSGRSSTNPYRIAPFVGTRLPFNGTISKDIVLHNPFTSTFRITEVCHLFCLPSRSSRNFEILQVVSSGGNVHVEMAYDIDGRVAGEPIQYWVSSFFHFYFVYDGIIRH